MCLCFFLLMCLLQHTINTRWLANPHMVHSHLRHSFNNLCEYFIRTQYENACPH